MEDKIDPQIYFDLLKEKKQETTDEFLTNFQDVIETEISKAMKMGQEFVVRRLAYALSVLTKERQLLQQGINVFVQREDIEAYITQVTGKVIKVIELEMYPRSIPDELVEKICELKEQNIFDRFYVVFTDYTGETEKQIEQEKRRKDPIIFGAFEQKIDGIWDIFDRFYYIGDWEDEFCDLTLSKMVEHMSKSGNDIVRQVGIEKATKEEILTYINNLNEKNENEFRLNIPKKKSFFKRVKTAWKELKG